MANDDDSVAINARGMKCPWPALRAARAMREAHAILIEADDPIAGAALAALSAQHGWDFAAIGQDRYRLSHRVSGPEAHEI